MLALVLLIAVFVGTEVGHVTSSLLVFNNDKAVSGVGRPVQTENFDWNRRPCRINLLAVLINHGTYATIVLAGKNDIAFAQGPTLNQHRRHRTASFIQTGFDNQALPGNIGRRT